MKELSIYVNDHFAGSTVGAELAKRAAGSNEGTEYGSELERLATEIEADREALKRVMDELDIAEDHLKAGAGWLAEKFGRLKLNGSLLSYSPLSRLIELEGLYLGVTGKLSLWTNLRESHGPRIGTEDLNELITRAESQRERLETLRIKAAPEALGPST
jgi:hypothetical protein